MPSLDAILPYIPRDTRVGLVREHDRVNQIEKDKQLEALVEEEQNLVREEQQRQSQQHAQQHDKKAPDVEDDDDENQTGGHLDTYA